MATKSNQQDQLEKYRNDVNEERQKKKKRILQLWKDKTDSDGKRESEKNLLNEDVSKLLLDTRYPRPHVESKKSKRLKIGRPDGDEGPSGFPDKDEYDRTGKDGRSLEDKISRSISDSDEESSGSFDEYEYDRAGKDGPSAEDKISRSIFDSSLFDSDEDSSRSFDEYEYAAYRYQLEEEEARDISDYEFEKADNLSDEELFVEFEPSILSENYMAESDDRIREIDIPERIQISEESIGPPPIDGKSIEEESTWILNQIGSGMVPLFSKEGNELAILPDDVVRFLEFLHVQKLEVPFIAMYRKQECRSLLSDPDSQAEESDLSDPDKKTHVEVLWAILELDRKWLLLQKRKTALQSYYNKRLEKEQSVYDETRLHMNQKVYDPVTKYLEVADSEQEIDDVDSKFNLHFPRGNVSVDDGQFKRPKRKSQYSICSKKGWEVACKFGYSSEEFGLLFSLAAVEISCEPFVRRHVRSIFMDNAVVSTNPTADGNMSIDSNHQFAGIEWLKDKPLTKFNDAQWLLIQKAEEEELIQVSVKLPLHAHDKLTADIHDYLLSNGVSRSAQLWNEQRKLIIEDAFDGLLLPSMAKEARALLTSKAKNWLLMEYGKLLWDKVSVAPYKKNDQNLWRATYHDFNSSDDSEAAPRVMACCWGPGNPATTFVMLDSYGEVLDVLYAGSLSIRGQSVHDQQRKKNDQQRVEFMKDHQPQVVVIGAVNMSCILLKEDTYEIIFKMVEDNPRYFGQEMDGIDVVYADETLPHLYENSRISSDQLQTQSGIVKRAVALERYLQNPLAMVATLCGPATEILSWKLSPLESFLTPDEKYNMVEQIMVDATNQVGLDVNLAISHEWLFAPLQFISGLGPTSLQRFLVRDSSIYTRKDLLNHGLDKKVFVNAVGFLRVRRSGNAASSILWIDFLDDTRIHPPESYALIEELARHILTADEEDDVIDEGMLEMAIEYVREYPTKLKCLDVDIYAKDMNLENKKEALNHIRLELIQGFQDWRKPFVKPNANEELYMLSGETPDTLSEGKIVQAIVHRVQPKRAVCALESGLTGMISRKDYSDDHRDTDLTEMLNEGDILTCMIKSIQIYQHRVVLSCRESDLRRVRSQNYKDMDPYYHKDVGNVETGKEEAPKAKELAKKHFKTRMIIHPRFQNITAKEALQMLSVKEAGESIVRPSSRGTSYLTLTLKIYDGVYAHKDIIEGGKANVKIGMLGLGDDVFQDLDEVMDRYVDPLVGYLKKMLGYPNFREGREAEVDEILRKEKAENPSNIVYAFGICHEHPGTFILTYAIRSNLHHEYVRLYPKGFKFRMKMFEELDKLVAYFQRPIETH